MNPKIFSQEKEYVHATRSFSLLLLLLLSLLILWCMNKYVFSFDFAMLIWYVVDIFFIRLCLWCFYCQDLFFILKICLLLYLFLIKNWFASSLDANLNFSKSKTVFFFLNKEKFVTSLDTNLNFFKSKKLIYIFFRYRSDFF